MNEKERVLVVDDDKDWTAVLRHVLEKEGFRVILASDGHEAIETALREKPDIVLVDMIMPAAWGHDVCRIIKGRLGGDSPKIVVISALKRSEDRARAMNAGADAYMTKPVGEQVLLETLRRLTDGAGREVA
jgi:DNA-binding response OmpR family regulator